jgi:cardiolipin synthase
VNSYTVINDGISFYKALNADLEKAKKSIDLQMMCFEADSAGLPIAEILSRKAKQGLRVRMLVDSFMEVFVNDRSVHLPSFPIKDYLATVSEYRRTKELYKRLSGDGVAFRMISPLGLFNSKLLMRNHKKIIVIDETIAYLGGINITEHNFAWHDYMFRIRGDVVKNIIRDFQATFDGKERDYPRKNTDYLSEGFSEIPILLESARRYIFIESPYLGGSEINHHLIRASKRGVEVVVIMPRKNNKWIYQIITEYQKYLFNRHKIRFLLFPIFTHSKIMVVDDKVFFGSCNFNSHVGPFLKEINIVSFNKVLHKDVMKHIVERDTMLATECACDSNIFHRLFFTAINWMVEHFFRLLRLVML